MGYVIVMICISLLLSIIFIGIVWAIIDYHNESKKIKEHDKHISEMIDRLMNR